MKNKIILILILSLIITIRSYSEWKNISYFDHVHYLTEINKVIYACLNTCGTNVYVSYNEGRTWGKLYLDTLNNDVFNVIIPFNNYFLAGTDYGNLYRSSNGVDWNLWSKINGNNIYSLVVIKNIIFASSMGQGIFRSLDSGKTWVQSNYGLSNLDVRALFIKDTILIAGTLGGGVYLSYDYGSTWLQRNKGLRSLNVPGLGGNNQILILGTDTSGVFISSDMGNNWNSTDLIYDSYSYYASFAVLNDTILAASEDEGVFISTDNGQKWKQINDGFNNICMWSLLIYNNNVYAGGFDGLYKRTLSSITLVEDMNDYDNNIFPNPALEYICLPHSVQDNSKIIIYSQSGKEVTNICIMNDKIDISDLSPGIYFLKIGKLVFKFIKI